MFVFRNSIGLTQHHRLMGTFDNIDLGNGGGGSNTPSGNEPPKDNPLDSPDINGGKGEKTDINEPPKDGNNEPPAGGNEPPKDGKDGNNEPPKDEKPSDSSTGGLEPGTNVEFEGQTYTVDKDGNVVDKDGNVFKEAKDVKAWLDSLNVNDPSEEITIDSIKKALGADITDEDGKPVEFTNDAEGVKAYVDSVIELRSNEIREAAINKVLQDNPLVAQFIDYVQLTGSPRGFGELPDRSGIEVDPDNADQQIAIIKMAAQEFGNATLNDNYIKYLKDSGGLLDEAKVQLQNLQAADKQRNDEYAAQAKAQRDQEIADTQAYWNTVNERIKARNIGAYKLPDTFVRTVNGQKVTNTPDDFFNYLYRQTEDKDGNRMSGYQRDLDALTDEQLLDKEILDAWLMFTGGTYKDLVDMAIREEKVKTLKLTAKENKGRGTVRITKPTNAKSNIDWDNINLS